MEIIADLHLHSKYSRAVSPQMTVSEIAKWAKKKGLGLVAAPDWTHPLWVRELKSELTEVGEGVYAYKEDLVGPRFLLVTELSTIFNQGEKLRRIHTLIFAPNFSVVEAINGKLQSYGVKLFADGRPVMGLSVRELAQVVWSVSDNCLVVPSHLWTPWFGTYGDRGGFNSLLEAYGEMASKIYAIETGHSCYDKKTEVLTDNGWKRFPKLNPADKICTLNFASGEIIFQSPTGIFVYQYKGRMYRLKTKRVNLMVTPNHKLLVSRCDFRKPPQFFLKEAELLFNKSKRFKKDGLWKGKNEKNFILPAVKIKHGSRYYSGFRCQKKKKLLMEPWLRFFGFWLAEGWTTKGRDGDYNVGVANKERKLLSEMKGILENFGYRAYRGKGIIRVRNYQLFHYLNQFGKSSGRFIPKEVKCLSKRLLEILFEYYLRGDGHVYGRTEKGLSATTISAHLRDDLQEIALKIGIWAYYKLGYKKGTPFHGGLYKDRIYKQSEDSWVVYFIRKNIHAVLPSTVRKHNYVEAWIDYDGPVYCVSVPNRVIYVRRNGIPIWCGNSDPAMNWQIAELDSRAILSFSDAHSPSKMSREATVFVFPEATKLSFAAVSEAIKNGFEAGKSPGVAFTIEFYPEEGKYHYTGHRNCGVKHTPGETKKLGEICPVCGRPLTVGVMQRVEELATRTKDEVKVEEITIGEGLKGIKWRKRPPYINLVPLMEILAEVLETGYSSQNVLNEYNLLIEKFGSEFAVLIHTPIKNIALAGGEKLAEAIKKVRERNIFIDPGFDGVFGKVKIWSFDSAQDKPQKQMSLF